MRITFLMGSFPWKPSGGAQVAYIYANRLAEAGHQVTLVHAVKMRNWTRPGKSPLLRRMKGAAQAILQRLRNPRPNWFALNEQVKCTTVWSLRAKVVPRADIVIATFWPTAEVAAQLPASKGVPVYLIQHLETWAGEPERILATWRLPIHKLLVSKWLYNTALEMDIPADQLTYLPNAIDHTRFHNRVPQAHRQLSVAMMYGEAEWKGARDGIHALEMAHALRPNLRALLFGVWKRPADLPSWIEYCQLPTQRQLAEDIYNQARIFLCPSHSEGWGLPSVEAMASGCALVTTNNGGSDDFAIHDQTALTAEPRDPHELAKQIHLLLHNPGRLQLIAEAGMNKARQFQWDRSARQLESQLLQLSAAQPPETACITTIRSPA